MPILHIVALKFKAEFSDEAVEKHFKEDARLKERCPDLVLDWSFSKNISLKTRADVNLGCNWVVHVTLPDEAALQAYLDHPKHAELGEIQKDMLEAKFVVDMQV